MIYLPRELSRLFGQFDMGTFSVEYVKTLTKFIYDHGASDPEVALRSALMKLSEPERARVVELIGHNESEGVK